MIIEKQPQQELIYLEGYDKYSDPYNVPVTESGIIELKNLMEFYDHNDSYEFFDCVESVLEANNMDEFCVAINEEDIILEPEITNLFENYVVIPVNENSEIYKECADYVEQLILDEAKKEDPYSEFNKIKAAHGTLGKIGLTVNKVLYPNSNKNSAIRAFNKWAVQKRINNTFSKLPGGDEDFKAAVRRGQRNEQRYKNIMMGNLKKDAIRLGKIGGIAGLSAAAIYKLAAKQKQPKSFIAKKIASFRSLYKNIINQANKNPKKAGIFKRVAAKILKVIDQLMAKLQTMAD